MTDDSAQESPLQFDAKLLRWFGWWTWLAPIGWSVFMIVARYQIAETWEGHAFLIRWSAAPLWFVLLFVCAYYLHLVLRRFRLSLSAYVVLFLLWGNATIAAFVFRDRETGVMTLLGLGALLGFAFTWSQSAGVFLDCRSRAKSAGLFVLAFLFPIAFPTLLMALALAWLNCLPNDPLIWCAALGGGCLSVAVIASFWLVHRRMRRAARAFLENAVTAAR